MGSYDECSESPSYLLSEEEEEEEQTLGIGEGRRVAEEEDPWSTLGIGEGRRVAEEDPWSLKKKKKKKQVFLEGCYVEAEDEEDQDSSKGVSRTVSLTDEDLDELKGCLDLGFGFNYEEIPELCTTLPALELCYSMSQRFTLDDQQQHKSSSTSPPKIETTTTTTSSSSSSMSGSGSGGPIANWKISSPGDHPEEVKARLKFWAQTVACTVKLCT